MKKFFRSLGVITAIVCLSGFVAPTTPVGAEETTSTTVSQPDVSTTTTSSESTTTTTTTTTSDTGDAGSPTTTVPDEDSPDSDPNGDTTTTLGDPLSDEEPADTVPQTDVTVPDDDAIDSKGRYSGQADFKPATVLWSSVRDAEAKVTEAQAELEVAIGRVKSLRLREKELSSAQADLSEQTKATISELAETKKRLQDRALGAFVRGGEIMVDPGGGYDDVLKAEVQAHLVDILLSVDDETIEDYLDLRHTLDSETLRSFDRTALVKELRVGFEAEVAQIRARIEQAQKELETFGAGSPIYVEGLVFPIGDLAYEVPMIDSYGFPRMMGTENEHWHEGIDIFAPSGSPLVATERGVITNIGTGKLGGLKVWLRGTSDTDWYYAHLSDFADGLHVGQVVEAGDLIGYVGTSGNAVGTPPHLHMQVHPGGGDAINPYPMLWVASERDIADYEAEQVRLAAEAALVEELAAMPWLTNALYLD